ncbi:MAG: class I SAM-dependent methyltransferase [Pirellulaceae bacterium]|jgi:SAM-dependent methyltransferase|nr:class I SAM-dependent methyltransferase [Pirellulaceae bacterium]
MKLEAVSCNLCGSNDASAAFSQADTLTDEPTRFSVVKCRHCGLQYVNPRPRAADMARFYPQDFVSYQFVLAAPGAPLRETVVAAITRSSARQRLKVLARATRLGPRTRVLDIGCGKGVFLNVLKEAHGCDVTGVDFDGEAVRYCREQLGIRAIHGGVADLAMLAPEFDVITLWHFLEHEFDPLAALSAAHRLLGERGRLIVEVPNVESAENAVFGRRSYLYDLPRHLYHFSPQTLVALLDRAGFELEHSSFTCLAGGWVGSMQNLLGGGRVYRRLADNVGTFLLLAQIALPFDWLTARLGRGSIMTAVAKKRPA